MGKRKRKRLPGHFCWVCGRQRPNEKFSGAGHKRHVCRDCAKLGPDELAYRQSVRDLDRCTTREGFIRRKQRAAFERFLRHEDPQIRAMAEDLDRVDSWMREQWRVERDAEEFAEAMTYFHGMGNDGDEF